MDDLLPCGRCGHTDRHDSIKSDGGDNRFCGANSCDCTVYSPSCLLAEEIEQRERAEALLKDAEDRLKFWEGDWRSKLERERDEAIARAEDAEALLAVTTDALSDAQRKLDAGARQRHGAHDLLRAERNKLLADLTWSKKAEEVAYKSRNAAQSRANEAVRQLDEARLQAAVNLRMVGAVERERDDALAAVEAKHAQLLRTEKERDDARLKIAELRRAQKLH